MSRKIFILFCFLLFGFSPAIQAEKILYLTSNNNSSSWTSRLFALFNNKIKNNNLTYNFNIEFKAFDELILFNKQNENSSIVAQLLKKKLETEKIDLIIAADYLIYSFLLENKKTLDLEGIKIIFTGFVPAGKTNKFKKENNTIAIVNRLSLTEQITLMRYLNKDDKIPIVIIYDYSGHRSLIQRLIEEENVAELKNIIFLPFISREELELSLHDIGEKKLLIFISSTLPKFGEPFSTQADSLDFLYSISNQSQIYVMQDIHLLPVVMGGVVENLEETANLLFDYTFDLLILNKNINELITIDPTIKYTSLNSKQITKFNINSQNIPKGTIFFNDSFFFIKQNSHIFLPILLFILIESFIILLLIRFYLKYKKTASNLQIILSDYDILFNQLNIPIITLDISQLLTEIKNVDLSSLINNERLFSLIDIHLINLACLHLLGITLKRKIKLSNFIDVINTNKFMFNFNEIINNIYEKDFSFELMLKKEDQSDLYVIINIPNLTLIRERKILPIYLQNITEQRKAEEELKYVSFFNILTGLPNKEKLLRVFLEYYNTYIATSTHHCLFFFLIDFDRFKYINEAYGHAFGDEILKIIAQRLTYYFNGKDIMFHIGADEFVLLVVFNKKETESACDCSIVAISEKIQTIIKERIILFNQSVYLSASVGVSISPRHGTQCLDLLSKADIALSKAKNEGKDKTVIYTEDMFKYPKQVVDLNVGFIDGIKNNEFKLFYQPLISAQGEIASVEVLIRWIKNNEIISPSFFIKEAEENKFIIALGEYIIENACKEWVAHSLNIPMAINLSAIQLQDKNFVNMIKSIIEKTKMPIEFFQFEFTESLVFTKNDEIRSTIDLLLEMGITFALDDFGTGFNSITTIAELPINKIKIDKSFVDLLPSAKGESLIYAIIQMSEIFYLETVAEGVETEQQVNVLSKLGCTYFQGYFFSKPLSIEDIIIFKNTFKTGKIYEKKTNNPIIGPISRRNMSVF